MGQVGKVEFDRMPCVPVQCVLGVDDGLKATGIQSVDTSEIENESMQERQLGTSGITRRVRVIVPGTFPFGKQGSVAAGLLLAVSNDLFGNIG